MLSSAAFFFRLEERLRGRGVSWHLLRRRASTKNQMNMALHNTRVIALRSAGMERNSINDFKAALQSLSARRLTSAVAALRPSPSFDSKRGGGAHTPAPIQRNERVELFEIVHLIFIRAGNLKLFSFKTCARDV
jgi:1,6-anhydro-N-acetylmuramate kinase